MRIFWLEGGLQIQPETNKESELLAKLRHFLETIKFGEGVESGLIGNLDDDQSISSSVNS